MEKFNQLLTNSDLTPAQQEKAAECLEHLLKAKAGIKELSSEVPQIEKNLKDSESMVQESAIILIAATADPALPQEQINDAIEHYLL